MIQLSSKPRLRIEKGIYAVAGISKNSGKTSFLNWLLSRADGTGIGVLTTGRDGEELDLVYGNSKPSVNLTTGTLFTTTSDVVDRLGSSVEVIQKLPYQAGTKKLWLLRALRDIETEIVGPANATAQIDTAGLMQLHGAELVFIDGSIDRKSIALSKQISGVFMIAGGSFGAIDRIQNEVSRLIMLSQITTYKDILLVPNQDCISLFVDNGWIAAGIDSLLGNEKKLMEQISINKPERIYLPGALTDSVWTMIKASCQNIKQIIIKHPLQLHLTRSNLENMVHLHDVIALHPFKIIAVAVNSWSVKGNHLDCTRLRNDIRIQFPHYLILDIREA